MNVQHVNNLVPVINFSDSGNFNVVPNEVLKKIFRQSIISNSEQGRRINTVCKRFDAVMADAADFSKAFRIGDFPVVQALLGNKTSASIRKALQIALKEQNIEMVKYLIWTCGNFDPYATYLSYEVFKWLQSFKCEDKAEEVMKILDEAIDLENSNALFDMLKENNLPALKFFLPKVAENERYSIIVSFWNVRQHSIEALKICMDSFEKPLVQMNGTCLRNILNWGTSEQRIEGIKLHLEHSAYPEDQKKHILSLVAWADFAPGLEYILATNYADHAQVKKAIKVAIDQGASDALRVLLNDPKSGFATNYDKAFRKCKRHFYLNNIGTIYAGLDFESRSLKGHLGVLKSLLRDRRVLRQEKDKITRIALFGINLLG